MDMHADTKEAIKAIDEIIAQRDEALEALRRIDNEHACSCRKSIHSDSHNLCALTIARSALAKHPSR